MAGTIAIPSPRQPPRLVRTAVWLFTRGPTFPLRRWRMHALRTAWQRGSSKAARAGAEDADPSIVDLGRNLRRELLAANDRKHAASGYRVLMLHPGSITADIWFGDLAQCLRHAGIDCQVLPRATPTSGINAAFESFAPNVFIATEANDALQALDLPFVRRYKRERGCLRMFIPVWHAGTPGGFSTPELDEWRRRLRADGLTADTHFSLFEPEFHERFSRDRAGPAIDYVAVPQACNPFVDYPMAVAKRYDYAIASSACEERAEVSYQFLRHILRRYRGLWAGPGWGFGAGAVPPADMPLRYSESRITLSPLASFAYLFGAELTHRVYAAAACGAFQLTMPTPITGRYFDPGELVQAASPREYVRLFDHYVDRPHERNAIALAALRRAYGEHTCFHRIDKLVSHWDGWRRRGLF